MLDDLRAEDVLVVVFSVILDALEGVRELRKDLPHHELFGKRERLHISVGYVQEFRLEVVSEVEVAEVLVTLHHVRQFVVFPVHSTPR